MDSTINQNRQVTEHEVGKQQGLMCASSTKKVQTSTNATGNVNENAER